MPPYNPQHQDKNKNASAKDDLTLIPWGAMTHVAPVMMYGADKYEPLGFYKVKNRRWTYIKACMRHMTAFFVGYARGFIEPLDDESGLPHLHHALACLMIAVDDSQDEIEFTSMDTDDAPPITARSRPHPEIKADPNEIGVE